jgi:hypothetical protein
LPIRKCAATPKRGRPGRSIRSRWRSPPRSNLGINAHASFSGALAWPYVYPWPQRPAGLVETAFDELAKRWRPILDHAEDCGVDICYEIHPGEDLHDGVTFEMFLERVGNHARCNMLYDPSHYVLQCTRLSGQHRHLPRPDPDVPRQGRRVESDRTPGRLWRAISWVDRAGRFRSLGDGQVDFGAIFSKLTQYDFDGWAVVEWECCLKHPEDGAREGAQFVKDHIIRVTERAFDDFADGGTDEAANRRMLGIERGSNMAIQGKSARHAAPHPPRHGGRRAMTPSSAACTASPPHRRPLRAGGRRVLLDAGKIQASGADLGLAPDRGL